MTMAQESNPHDPHDPAAEAVAAALASERELAHEIASDAVAAGGEQAAADQPAADDAQPDKESAQPVDLDALERSTEALLFAASEPVAVRELARAADSNSATMRKILAALKETLDRERRPYELAEVAGAYRLVTRPEFHAAIQRLKTQTSQRKLTQAALETLALIAYRQPIGKAEVESVRGVNVGPVLRVLLEKKLIQISGRGTGVV